MPYSVLFPQPRGARPDAPWYWALVGPVAVVHISTEHDFKTGSQQHDWLRYVLPRLNRAVAPYLVVLAHRPSVVCSRQGNSATRPDGHIFVAGLMREHLLPLLTSAGATLLVGGHHHSYQRHCPVSPTEPIKCSVRQSEETLPALVGAGEATASTTLPVYRSPPGPIHVNVGHGGVPMDDVPLTGGLPPAGTPGGDTLEVMALSYGYARITVSPAGGDLEWSALPYAEGAPLLDQVRILQDAAAVAAKALEFARTLGVQQWSAEEMLRGEVGRAGAPPAGVASAASTPAASGAAGASATAAPTPSSPTSSPMAPTPTSSVMAPFSSLPPLRDGSSPPAPSGIPPTAAGILAAVLIMGALAAAFKHREIAAALGGGRRSVSSTPGPHELQAVRGQDASEETEQVFRGPGASATLSPLRSARSGFRPYEAQDF